MLRIAGLIKELERTYIVQRVEHYPITQGGRICRVYMTDRLYEPEAIRLELTMRVLDERELPW